VDTVLSQHEARWSALMERSSLPPPLAAWLAHFDLVVNYWPDADGAIGSHFPVSAEQRYLATTADPRLSPAARHYCEPLRALGLETDDFRSRIRHPITRSATIAVHPGSGSARKNWPLDRWRALLEQLDAPLLIVGGEVDEQALHALSSFGEVCVSRPLPEVATRLAACRGFIGHDSGISHLAAAVGTPCLLLFGPTDPEMWAPPGAHVRVVRRGTALADLDVGDVLAMTKRHFFADQTGPA
jgi:hypothetical protein